MRRRRNAQAFVARVVPADKLMDEALKAAETIAAHVDAHGDHGGAGGCQTGRWKWACAEGILFERRLFHAFFATARPEGRHGGLRRENAPPQFRGE